MKRKSMMNLMAAFIIACSPILPFYDQNAEAAAAADSRWLTYKYDGFPQDTFDQSFAVDGTAEVPQGTNFVRLTPQLAEKSGAIFNKNTLYPKDNYSFSTAFSFKMANPSAAGASDGLTFTLQTGTTSQGAIGGGLGYYGIQPSFAVKYDTFLNTVYNDPSANYIGLAENGTVTNQAGKYTDLNQFNQTNGTNYVLSNGTLYYTWIDYDGLNKNVQVRLGTSPERASSKMVLDVNNIDLGAIFGGNPYYAGFTASTGYPNYETHDINSWYFKNAYAPIDTLDPQNDYYQNQPPTASDLKVTAERDKPVTGVVNGTDPNNDTLTYAKGTDPGHGTVMVDPDGKWTYTPETGYVGPDSFTVIVDDGKGGKIEVPVTVDVTKPVNPPPFGLCGPRVALINGSFEQPEARNPGDKGSPGAEHAWMYFYQNEVPGWQTTATDDFIQIMQNSNEFLGPKLGGNGQTIPVVAADGKQFAELNANQPAMLYQDVQTNPGQTIYWRLAHRGEFGVDTMQLRIGSPDISPDRMPVVKRMDSTNNKWTYYTGTYTVPEGQTVTRFGFEAVDTSNGDLLWGNLIDDIFLGTEPCGVTTKSVTPIDNVQEGDIITYTVNFKNEGGDETGNTVFTDTIPDGTEFVPGSLEIVSGPNSGKLTDAAGDDQGEFLTSEKRVVVRLGNGANGSQAGRIPNVDVLPDGTSVQFQVKILSKYKTTSVANQASVEYDNLLSGNHETRNSNGVTVDVNRPPISPDFEETTWKNTTVTGSVYGVDANGDSLTFAKGTNPANGTVTIGSDGTWTYVPNTDFTGTDSFEVTVVDGKGGTSTSIVTINVVNPPNQAPVTDNYNVTTQQDTPLTGSVDGSDSNGDPLTFAIETNPKHGTVIVNTDGTWTYEPDPGYSGPDIFTVTVSDGKGGITTSTITVNVEGKPNRPPVTRDDTVTTPNNTPLTGIVNGMDPDGDLLTYAKGTDPKHGTVAVNPNGTWTYVPEPGYVGEDSFTVIVDDGRGGKMESKITVDVTETITPTPPANQPPTASGENVTTEKDKPATGTVNGSDPDGDLLTYTKGKDPEHGTVTVNPDGSWTYVPEPGYQGGDSFTVIVDDGKGGKTTVTITVDVKESGTAPGTTPGTTPGTDSGTTPGTAPDPGTGTDPAKPNQLPSVPSYVTETTINTPATGKINGTDADGDSLTYSKGSDPKHGTVTVNPDGTWTYVPDRDYIGTDSFMVTVGDGRGGTTTSVVTVNVTETETGTTVPGTPEPTNPGSGTTPTIPGSEPTPSNPGTGTTPTHPVGISTDSGNDSGESAKVSSPADQAGRKSGNKLPNTATHVYNLGFLGIIILLTGWLLRRKNKVQ